MGMDGARAEHQLVGDLQVGKTIRQQAQHLHLACRQPVGIGWWGHNRGRDWSWFLALRGQCPLRRHGSPLGPGGSESSLSQVDTRSRQRALIVSEFNGRDGYSNRVA